MSTKENIVSNPAVEALIRQAIADMEPRIQIYRNNIMTAEAAVNENQELLDELLAQRAELLAALPEPDASDE